jgi:hypothetical protein
MRTARIAPRVAASLVLMLLPAGLMAEHKLTVEAGDVDRRGTLVAVDIPAEAGAGPWGLVGPNRQEGPVAQRGPDGRVWFTASVAAGESATYTLEPGRGPSSAELVKVKQEPAGALRVARDLAMLRYQGEQSALPEGYDASLRRGGYISHVWTPAGALVSDDYPPNHKHHHGVWSPWTKTVFEGRTPDFWNMGDKTGTVETVSFGDAWSGPVAGGFRARHRMLDLTAPGGPRAAIDEQWDVTAYGTPMGQRDAHVFDLVITQTCASDSPLELPKYHYGGLGFRGSRQWDGVDNCRFLTSEGKTRADGNETRAKWCHVGGLVDGKPAGVAILCHPDNFRFPQPVRLHPAEPFFCFAPSQLGDWTIEPGKPYVAKYRFIVSDGEPDAREIERQWRDYAAPVKVSVE